MNKKQNLTLFFLNPQTAYRHILRVPGAIALLLAFTLNAPVTGYAHNLYESGGLYGTWQRDDKGWWFENQGNPPYAFSRWGEYRGHSYYFNAEGYMVTGWQYIDRYWYYFNPQEGSSQGAMMTGWLYDPIYNGWFYLNDNGIMVTGWRKLNGYWYYFHSGNGKAPGIMASDEIVDESYIDKNGRMNELPN